MEQPVLLVEDDSDDVYFVTRALTQAGLAVEHVETLGAAVRYLETSSAAVILLDLHLPDAIGDIALSTLRQRTDAPIVILTASSGDLALRAASMGAEDFLSKGVRPELIVRTVVFAMARANRAAMQREANINLRNVLLGAAQGLIVVDARGEVVLANPRALQLLGRPAEAMLGTRFEVSEQIERRQGQSPDGQPLELELSASSVRWDGAAASLISITDITERRRAEQLSGQLAHAQRVLAIGQLAAGVAHEINNPAQYLMTNLHVLRDQLAAWEFPPELEISKLIDESLDGIGRIARIVRELKHYASHGREHLGRTDVNDAVRDALRLLEYRTQPRLELGELPEVLGDRAALAQAVANLILNADVAVSAAGEGAVTVRTEVTSGAVWVSVQDDGIGMDAEGIQRAQEPFYTTRNGEATGLGLTVCAEVARRHGGQIELRSEPGVGTVAALVLPVAEAETPAPAGRVSRPPREILVLLVSADESLHSALRTGLSGLCRVTVAADPAEALAAIEESPDFDAVVCDAKDGRRLLRTLQAQNNRLAERCVMLVETAAVVHEGWQVLEKPVRPGRLLQVLSEIVLGGS